MTSTYQTVIVFWMRAHPCGVVTLNYLYTGFAAGTVHCYRRAGRGGVVPSSPRSPSVTSLIPGYRYFVSGPRYSVIYLTKPSLQCGAVTALSGPLRPTDGRRDSDRPPGPPDSCPTRPSDTRHPSTPTTQTAY